MVSTRLVESYPTALRLLELTDINFFHLLIFLRGLNQILKKAKQLINLKLKNINIWFCKVLYINLNCLCFLVIISYYLLWADNKI